MRTRTVIAVGLSVAALGICAAASASNSLPALPREPLNKKRTPKEAAGELLAYVSPLVAANDLSGLGVVTNPSNAIANLQRDMGGVASDGIYGPKTATRGAELLGRAFPARPKPKPALTVTARALPSSSSGFPTHAVEVLDKAPQLAALPAPKQPAPLPPPAAAAPEVTIGPVVIDEASPARTPKEAARALLSYVSPLVRAGKTSELGSKQRPNDFIAAAQRDMRLVASDGVYGPKTAARGKELIGTEFPTKRKIAAAAVPAPPAPNVSVAPRSPLEAATALRELVTTPPVDWGAKAKPNLVLREAQQAMGGLNADGVYGPKTKARGEKLTAQSFPNRGETLA